MRQNSTANIAKAKSLARRKYAERQIDKYINWSLDRRGWVKFKDIKALQDKYNIKCYG